MRAARCLCVACPQCISNVVTGCLGSRSGSGLWLLLDELNLAPDTVLQAIESAIDTGELTLANAASSSSSVRVIRRHPDFRLFATQNPASGLFKHAREPLTHDFLSRFQPLEFSALPDAEWVDIVTKKLVALGACLRCIGLSVGLGAHAQHQRGW